MSNKDVAASATSIEGDIDAKYHCEAAREGKYVAVFQLFHRNHLS